MSTQRHKRIATLIRELTYEEMTEMADWFAEQSRRDDDDAPDMSDTAQVSFVLNCWAVNVHDGEI